jgi:SAM-dependent methyltransferase
MLTEELQPPPELIAYASGSADQAQFRAIGKEFLDHFRDLTDLQPNARVLDVGCGCGRMALVLAEYLDQRGSYEGIDIDTASIHWASEHITKRYPNFRFQRADVFNTTYNPKGKVRPDRYRLPFGDMTFDFVLLTSVFTHMLPRGMRNYLSEVIRVLKVNSKCLITMFLLNSDKSRKVLEGAAAFQFPHRSRDCYVQDINRPEDVVGYDEASIVRQFQSEGLKLLEPPLHGKWSGDLGGFSSQDLLIAQKTQHVGVIGRAIRRLSWPGSFHRSQFVSTTTIGCPTA